MTTDFLVDPDLQALRVLLDLLAATVLLDSLVSRARLDFPDPLVYLESLVCLDLRETMDLLDLSVLLGPRDPRETTAAQGCLA